MTGRFGPGDSKRGSLPSKGTPSRDPARPDADVPQVGRSRQAFRESREQLALAMDAAGLALWDQNFVTGEITRDRRWAEMLGYTLQEIESSRPAWKNLIHPEDLPAVDAAIEAHEAGRTPLFRVEHRLRTRAGEWCWVLNWGKIVERDEHGRPVRAVGIHLDITDRRRVLELEAQAQRLEGAARIAGQVAHDSNNLLSPLMAYPEFLRRALPPDHQAQRYVTTIEQAARQLSEINQQLLTLGRRGHYQKTALDLNEVIEQAVSQLEPRPSTIELRTDLLREPLVVRGGKSEVLRAVTNVILNARDALPDGGRITVRTGIVEVDDVPLCVGRIPPGTYARVAVVDNGPGITKRDLSRIFEPFFTTRSSDRHRGSGLGLSVVDAVMKDHHGHVDLETGPGRGTSVFLYFPRLDEAPQPEEEEEILGGNERVLVVDDDPVQRSVSLDLLQSLGYRAQSVASGEEACRAMERSPPDLLLLDMVMPGGMDGTETYRRAVAIHPGQKALLVSGFSPGDRLKNALALGIADYLPKPFTREKLAAALRRVLDR